MSDTPHTPATDTTPEFETLRALLDTRYSCRQFRPEPVPRAALERWLALAQRTASWCNSQPWQVDLLSGAATESFRQALAAHVAAQPAAPDFPFPAQYTGLYRERRKHCAVQLYESVGVEMGDRAASRAQSLLNYQFFGAPHVLIISSDAELGTYGAVDCGAYVANLMLIARSLGIDTIAQAALATHSPFVREFLGLPEDRRIVCGMSLGYADTGHPVNRFRTERAPLQEVVRWRDGA